MALPGAPSSAQGASYCSARYSAFKIGCSDLAAHMDGFG